MACQYMIPIEVIAISTFAGSIDSRAFKVCPLQMRGDHFQTSRDAILVIQVSQSSTLTTVETISLIPRKSGRQDVSGASRLAFPTFVPPAFEVTSSPRRSG